MPKDGSSSGGTVSTSARPIDDVIRLVLRKLAWRHPHWPAAVRDDIKTECDGELHLVEEITEYWDLVRLVAEMNELRRQLAALSPPPGQASISSVVAGAHADGVTVTVTGEWVALREERQAIGLVTGRAVDLLRDLIDNEDCRFDHHGGCQAHGYLALGPGERCPQAEAKEFLIEIDRSEAAS